MNENLFTIIAELYDKKLAGNRFDYGATVDFIASFLKKPPVIIADLASGTGLMADAILKKWNVVTIHCEEASINMITLFEKRLPHTPIFYRKLQKSDIPKQTDLVTIAFNSINYVSPDELSDVFSRIRKRMSPNGILYIDTLLKSLARNRLNGKKIFLIHE